MSFLQAMWLVVALAGVAGFLWCMWHLILRHWWNRLALARYLRTPEGWRTYCEAMRDAFIRLRRGDAPAKGAGSAPRGGEDDCEA
jgi:hypothetical protein